jgi:DNA-binding Lrp family transcriptional regulator
VSAPAADAAAAGGTLDDVDLRLLRILQADGRITD